MSADGLHLSREQRGQVRRATNRLFTLERREFPSSSDPAVMYEATVHQDGKVMCNCRGWTIKKGDQPRQCKHTKIMIGDRRTRQDDEYVYVVL